MAYPTELTVDSNRPIEVFEVTYGREAGSVFRYTDAPVSVTVDGNTYAPLAITRTTAKVEGNGRQSNIQIVVPLDCDLAELFVQYPPNVVVALVIRSGQMPADPSVNQAIGLFPPVWAGVISESSREGSEATLECKTPVSDLEMPGLQRFYSWTCGLSLYGTRCAANKAAAATANVVDFVSEIVPGRVHFVADTGWLKSGTSPSDYIGGYVEWTGPEGADFASIKNAGSNYVDLLGRLVGLGSGVATTVYLGCPRTMDKCVELHNNAVNYGGQPWIPTENPIRERGF